MRFVQTIVVPAQVRHVIDRAIRTAPQHAETR